MGGHCNDLRLLHRREVYPAKADRHQIGADDAQQNRNDLDHALAPDVADHDDGQRDKGEQPVLACTLDGGGGQGSARSR